MRQQRRFCCLAIPDPSGICNRGGDPSRGDGGNYGSARDHEDPRDHGSIHVVLLH